MSETKLNSGAIFKNEKKTAETHPDYRGKINVDGVEKEISLWLKTATSGIKYFSVSIKEPWIKPEGVTNNVNNSKDDNEDLPF